MSRLVFNKFLGADYENIKQGRLKFYNWTERWKLGGKVVPTWRDIILHGVTALTLVNAKAGSLEYLKLFGGTEQLPSTYLDTVTLSGGCEQSGTPTPSQPLPIVCNNGAIKVSKNLFNATWEQGAIAGAQNKTYEESKTDLTTHIRVVNEIYLDHTKTYTISINNPDLEFVIQAFNEQHKLYVITNVSNVWGASPKTFTGAYGVAVALRYKNPVDILPSEGQNAKVQIEEGSTATSYMPYGKIYTDGIVEQVTDSLGNTANAERLLAVGTYKDTQEVLNGSVTRRVGIKVLNGTEDWSLSGTSFRFDGDVSFAQPNTCLCTHFVGWLSSDSINDMPDLSIKAGHPTNTYRVYLRYDRFTTVQELTSWLATQYTNGNPVIITYPLATTTSEAVAGQFLSKSPVTQTAGSISNLPIAITESGHTVPTPTQPLPINCNNGVVKVSKNLFDKNTIVAGYAIDASGNINENSNFGYTDLIPVEQAEYITNNLTMGNATWTLRIHGYSSNGTWVTQIKDTTITSIVTQVDFLVSNTNIKYVRLSLGIVNRQNLDILQLYPTQKPIGSIYTDGTTETVEIVTGKNLFNQAIFNTDVGTTITYEWLQIPNGTYTMSTNFPPKTSTQYTNVWILSGKQTGGADSTANGVSLGYPKTITVTDGWYTIAYRNTVGDIQRNPKDYNWQFEQGSTATAYEPYFNGGTATAENLFKVGTYQDVQSVIDGNVTRNVGIKVLNGTENWIKSGSAALYYRFLKIGATNEWGANSSVRPLCTHVIGENGIAMNTCFFSLSDFVFQLDGKLTVAEFKAWLANQYNAGTPVIIVYPTSSPTTETVTPQPMNIQEGTNIVQITQASMDNLELEVKYKAGVSVTITEIENAQLDNNVEVTING